MDMVFAMERDIFKARRKMFFITGVIMSLAVMFFMSVSDIQLNRILTGSQKIGFYTKLYFPPEFNEMGRMMRELWLTIAVSIGSTVVASVFAFFASLCASEAVSLNKTLGRAATSLGLICRNVPIYVWQLLLGMIFYMGGFFLAFLIIFITSLGFLIRTFQETIDETSSSSIEALEATGASKMKIITNAVIPDTLAQLVSWTLFCIETNIRSSSLIGYLTGSGIGFLVSFYRGFKRDLPSTLGVIIVIAVSLILWDFISNKLRGVILGDS